MAPPPLILIADADQTSLELAAAVLLRDGFRVVATPDGGDALARCMEEAPALVLCAEALPVVSGPQLCKQVKAQFEATRVVVLADEATSPGREEQWGCDAILPRPFRYAALKEKLSSWGIAIVTAAQPVVPEFSFSVPVPEPMSFDFASIAPPEPGSFEASPAEGSVLGPMPLPLPLPLEAPVPATPEPGPVASVVVDAPGAAAVLEAPLPIVAAAPVVSAASPPDDDGELDLDAIAADSGFEARTEEVAIPNFSSERTDEFRPPMFAGATDKLTLPVFEARTEKEIALPVVLAAPAAEGTPAIDLQAAVAPALVAASSPRAPSPDASFDERTAEIAIPNLAHSALADTEELDLDAIAATPEAAAPAVELAPGVELAPAVDPARAAELAPAVEPVRAAEPNADLPELVLDDVVAPESADALEIPGLLTPAPAPAGPDFQDSSPDAGHEVHEAPAASDFEDSSADAEVTAVASVQKKSQLPVSVPRYGDLVSMPLPRLVFELYVATFSGVLLLARQGMKRALYFWGGLPVRADSEQLDDNLGRLLISHGRITEEQNEVAAKLARERKLSEGDALVSTGAIRKSELLDALRELTEQRLVNVFAWRDGTYRLDANTEFADKSLLTEVHPVRAIWRGVVENYDLNSLLAYFAGLRDRYAVATELFKVHFETLGPFLRTLDIAELLDGQTTFQAALRSDDSRAMDLAQAFYVLLVTDMVRPSQKPGPAALVPERAAPKQKASSPVDYRAITRVCDEIAREYLRIKDCDYFEALRVELDSPLADVEAAYVNNVKSFLPDALPTGLPDDVQRRAQEIVSLLTRAKSVLRDPQLKERYIAAQRSRFEDDEERAPAAASAPPAMQTDEPLALNPSGDDEREARTVAERAHAEGQRLTKQNELALAKDKFDVAIRLNGNEPSYRVALAQVLLLQRPTDVGAQRLAAAALQAALQLDPSHVDANFEMGKLLVTVGQAKSAKTFLGRVVQRAPQHREARALLAKLG